MNKEWFYHKTPKTKNSITTDTQLEAFDLLSYFIPDCVFSRSEKVDFCRNKTTGMVTLTASPQIIYEATKRLDSLNRKS
ncbi:hypothetical protein HY029_05070 [Candidatus Gottesmanbacteria bacterium]|nr:hypothetical protein [Candidatus Gottesmanbacteria bacterium]